MSFELPRGIIFGIIGPNGAGKTTLINVLSGLIKPTSGTVTFQGERIENLPAHAVAARGITRTYQNLRLFKGVTARENVIIGQHLNGRSTLAGALIFSSRSRREESEKVHRANELLDLVGLLDKADVRADALSYGDARRLEIARALGSNPSLLLLDEPAAGMNHIEVEHLGGLIRKLADGDRSILLIEHHMGLVMSVCQRVAVLNFGEKLAEGSPAEVAANPAVIEAYLGQS